MLMRLGCASLVVACGDCMGQILPAHVRAVRAGAGPGGNGTSWALAVGDLQEALDLAAASGGTVREIWIAQGTYLPPVRDVQGSACAWFEAEGVSLRGGFLGIELSASLRPGGTLSVLAGRDLPYSTECPPVLRLRGTGPLTCDRLWIEGVGEWRALAFEAGGAIAETTIRARPYHGPAIVLGIEPVTVDRCTIWAESHWNTALEFDGPHAIRDSVLFGRGRFTGGGVHVLGGMLERCAVEGFGDGVPGVRLVDTIVRRCWMEAGSSFSSCFSVLGSDVGESRMLVQLAGAGYAIDVVDSVIRRSELESWTLAARPFAGTNSVFEACRFSGRGLSPGLYLSWSHLVNSLVSGVDTYRTIGLDSGSRITNSIVWGNFATGEPSVIHAYVPVEDRINFSCIQGWTGAHGGVGNFGADPLLGSGGRPLPGSPCVDTGDDGAVAPGVLRDLGGNCRWADGDGNGVVRVDIGPYELGCAVNCDCSSAAPVLNVADFTCFLERFAAGDSWANCDGSSAAPVLNVGDFTCFVQRFAAGCG